MAISDRTRAVIESPSTPVREGVSDNNTNSIQYSYEQDTNRLARSDIQGTVHSIRDSRRRSGIPIAGTIDTWDEPLSSANPRYNYNQVYKPDPGDANFIQEFDNTPENERYHLHHPSGTYYEIDANGTETRKIVGDNFVIIENNGRIFIAGEATVTVGGSCNIIVLNDAFLQVGGKLDAVVKSDINMTTSGSFNLNVKDVFKVKAEEYILETTRYNHTNAGETKLKTREYTVTADTVNESITENKNISAKNHNITTSESNFVNTVDSNINASGAIKHKSSGVASFDGSEVRLGGSSLHLNASIVKATTSQKETVGTNVYPVSSAGPSAAEAPSGATAATVSDPKLTGFTPPSDRSVSVQATRPDLPQRTNRIVRTAVENDGGSASSSELYPGYNNVPPYVGEQEPSNITRATIDSVPSTGEFTNTLKFTGEEQLSKYIKLKDVSTAAFFPHSIRAQGGLTEGQIVTNLQALALNVLDKICDRYGRSTFRITSGFRPEASARGGQGLSKHGFGQAVDIQFPNVATSNYVNLARDLVQLIDFDQLILEYQSGGSGKPWIHIQYVEAGNRRQYFTMLDHRRNSAISTV